MGSTNVGAITGVFRTFRTVTGNVSGTFSSVATALFLAVACDKRPEGGGGGYRKFRDRTIFAKLKIRHTGARLAVEALHLCECADLISLTRGSVAQWGQRWVSGGSTTRQSIASGPRYGNRKALAGRCRDNRGMTHQIKP